MDAKPAAHHIIVEGEALASVAGSTPAHMGPGEGFGETALLRDIPRTATVVAASPLWTVKRD